AVLGKIVWSPNGSTRIRLTGDHLDDHVATHVLTANTASSLDTQARDRTVRDRVSLDWHQQSLGPIDALNLAVYWQKSDNRQFSAEHRTTLAD
ncbi:hypothetical protein ACSTJJ_22985, partial [Vibrio parahaemolyticus]